VLSVVVKEDSGGFVALCPELDIASQGNCDNGARANLKEAIDLFFECAAPKEVADRLAKSKRI
jgi:predicted RNase H-like HicB family nuclease